MSDIANELLAELDDCVPSSVDLHDRAGFAVDACLSVVRRHKEPVIESVLAELQNWWHRHYPPVATNAGWASHHALQSVLHKVRADVEGGS